MCEYNKGVAKCVAHQRNQFFSPTEAASLVTEQLGARSGLQNLTQLMNSGWSLIILQWRLMSLQLYFHSCIFCVCMYSALIDINQCVECVEALGIVSQLNQEVLPTDQQVHVSTFKLFVRQNAQRVFFCAYEPDSQEKNKVKPKSLPLSSRSACCRLNCRAAKTCCAEPVRFSFCLCQPRARSRRRFFLIIINKHNARRSFTCDWKRLKAAGGGRAGGKGEFTGRKNNTLHFISR